MKKAYIILTQNNPNQLLRLIKRLDDNKSLSPVHIDKQTDITHFEAIATYNPAVRMLNPKATH